MQFSSELLNGLIAPGIAELMQVTVPELGDEFPEERHWIANLFLNSVLERRYKRAFHQAVVTFIVRIQTAMGAYRTARQLSLDFVEASKPGSPAMRCYFQAVSSWETCLLNVQIGHDLIFKFLAPEVVATDDAARIRLSANRVKHFAEDVKKGEEGVETIPLWLDRDRLRTRKADVSYEELLETIREMARSADILQHPIGAGDAGEIAH